MSRYYEIAVDGGPTYKSLGPDGLTDPGALNVEVDIQVVDADTPAGGSMVRIWGIGIDAISQTQSYFNKKITVKLGMAAGLPLAKPQQAGQACSGIIYQTFGNWIGVDQTLDLIFTAGTDPPTLSSPAPPPPMKNLVLDWQKGKPLSDALKKALQTAYPGQQIAMAISDKIVATQTQQTYHPNLQQLGAYVRAMSQQIMGGNYQGVGITQNNNKLSVFDGSQPQSGAQIAFEDLIGQPTWIDFQTVQFKTVMRADINMHDTVTLPKTLITNTQQGSSNFVNNGLAFQGSYQISKVRHVGNYRQTDAASWVTVFDAIQPQAGGGGAGAQ